MTTQPDPSTARSLRFCPECGEVAVLEGRYDNEETGFEVAMWRCPNGHHWEQPSNAMIVRMIGWGHSWRQKRDEVSEWY
jgi:hypothetical protein